MQIVIHTRHADLADDFSEIVKEKINSLGRFSVEIERIEVEVLKEGNPSQGKESHHVIITTHGAGPFFRSEAKSFNDLAAFDDAVSSIELQIRKVHEKSKSKDRDSLRFKKGEVVN
jgi:ribosomal subunit interface protein